MTNQFTTFHSVASAFAKQLIWGITGVRILATSLWAGSAFAGDPLHRATQNYSS